MTQREIKQLLSLGPAPKIVTHHIKPPIPTKRFDWVAYFDGRELEGPYGYGPSAAEAVLQLWMEVLDQ